MPSIQAVDFDVPPAITALLGNEVNLAFDTLTVLAPQIKGGKVKGLVISGKDRSPLIPDVPSAAEAGLPQFDVTSWFGIVVPAATPKEIVARLNQELVRIAKAPEVQERLSKSGLDVASTTPEAFAKAIRDDHARWGEIVRLSGNFCDGCNRVRVNCRGELRLCLGERASVDLRPALAQPRPQDAVRRVIRSAVKAKPGTHSFSTQAGASDRSKLPMHAIGG